MKKLLLALIMASAAFAAPLPCPSSGTLQDFIDFGSAGCYIGRATFSDFQLTLVPGATSNPSSTQIDVSSVIGSGVDDPDSLTFDNEYLLSPNQSINFIVDFNVTARLPGSYLFAVSLSGEAETSSGNNAKVHERIYDYPALNLLANMQLTQGNSPGPITRTFDYQTTIHVSKEFELDTQNNQDAFASLGPVRQDFFATPEPGTVAYLLGGVALLMAGKFKRRSSRL
jgi:hypothetical protein